MVYSWEPENHRFEPHLDNAAANRDRYVFKTFKEIIAFH